jgi:WD40 repeat protein
VTFSPDGAHIVSGSFDMTVRVWDAPTGGAHIASGSEDKTVLIWDARKFKQLAAREGHSKGARSVPFSPDGVYIVSGAGDQSIRVWDTQTSQQIAVFEGHSDKVLVASFSPDGAYTTVRPQLAILEGHSDGVWSVAFSPDGLYIILGSSDWSVRVWDVRTGPQSTVLEGHSGRVRFVSFSLTERTSSRARVTRRCEFGISMCRRESRSLCLKDTTMRCSLWHSRLKERTLSRARACPGVGYANKPSDSCAWKTQR